MILCGGQLAERVDRAVFPFTQGGAQMHTIAAKAVAFGEAATPAFAAYAHQVVANAKMLAEGLAAEGLALTTGGPTPHAHRGHRSARSRRTQRTRPSGRRRNGPRHLRAAHGDARGLRLGTAALTTQGMGEAEMSQVAKLFAAVLRDEADSKRAREEVRDLAGRFPPYPDE
ncbi:hypothetical protein O1M63_35060 [Streptomyces mirabilis]|nr:hypothetical protein [Streptomyces mirabilis]